MQADFPKPLYVLNASAGSGKTFSLVRNYLRLLLLEGENRTELGQIIAMTFTNKAALEMKTRILSDLNKLANGGKSTDQFCAELAEFIGMKPENVQKNAKIVLKKMMHQFENFNVMTIDKFNLKLIRSFSRDLNLPDQFQVIIDENLILEKAVDELLNTIDTKDQNRIYKLSINFAKDNLDQENKWNVKTALLDSAKILKNERSFQTIRNLVQKDFTEVDLQKWKVELKVLLDEISARQRNLQLAYESDGVTKDQLPDKSRFNNAIEKLISSKGNVSVLTQNLSLTDAQKGNLSKLIASNDFPLFANELAQFCNWWEENLSNLFELDLKIKQFYLLAILRELAISMENIREKESIIRISEFNQLVADLVKNEDAPFIYERLGNRYNHFFLDEFQDTSRLQWLNLIPLVHNSLAQNFFNFIVGDPKQSIYRFKNGIAEQFVELPALYNPELDPKIAEKSIYFSEMGTLDGLENNWRSAQEIVEFNNRFFTEFVKGIHERGQKHYNHILQVPKGKADGLLVFEFPNFSKDEDESDLDILSLEKWVNECISDGYSPGDICILSKRKKECNSYANFLKSKGFSVVSSDSLMVESDSYVQLAIAFLKWRNNPLEKQYGMRFSELYFRLNDETTAFHQYEACFVEHQKEDKASLVFDISTFLQISGLTEDLLTYGYSSLYGLIQQFIRFMKLDELKNPYLHQLLDVAFKFDLNSGPDLMRFIEHFEETARKSNVQLPENKHSIKIMTAHKSKGLEFPVVLVPSFNFRSGRTIKDAQLLEINENIVQSNLSKKDFALPGVEELSTIENEDEVMDALNLMYVTFTRPIDRLYVRGEQKSAKGEDFEGKTKEILSQLYPEHSTDAGFFARIGQAPIIENEDSETTGKFTAKSLDEYLWFPDISLQSTEEEQKSALNLQKRLGTQYHRIMEQARTKETALETLSYFLHKGIVEQTLESELELLIEFTFKNQDLVELLATGTHLDERTLLIDEKISLRPDKIILTADKTIVVDFKTGEEKGEHLKQVSDYAFALDLIGYKNIVGYLFYAGGIGLKQVKFGLYD